jgi:hypothetical protein
MSFFKENEIDLAGLETGIIDVNGSKIPITYGDTEESPESMETMGMVSRKTLKRSSDATKLNSSIYLRYEERTTT